ncbi:saccharopine dehydrogenase NADP-binding domain-containing protein [Actinophytocola sp.]|uniref:saccharopine dehydrogenase NADP-binding domain-containing protein n=1 Tax=Actinophytocola sp. TaxID=1872138 RepID=UPI002D7E26E8|nr:saccharopine dehydrogenase NADP-binding domain-containing protein [Actinophytocola sp.]HET9139282.1 saccharopine dehydrogenase NADP-binding domain-containing protein [Actinophytocola sp.]
MDTGSILIVGGYGVVGSRIAADLAVDFPGRVVVAGRSQQRADAAAAAIGHGVRGRRVDVGVPSSIAAALDDVAVAVNCIDQPDRALLWAAIERGLAYTDITPHLTDLGRGAAYERIDAAATASGARIVLGAGMVPGISNVMVRALAEVIGGVDTIETSLLLSADDVLGPGSFDYLLQELTMSFDVHVDGADRRVRAFTAPRGVDFPAPLGIRRAYLFPFSDQVLYPRTVGARTVVTRLAINPPRMSRLLALLVSTRATHITARPRIRALLGRLRRGRTGHPDAPYALRVDVIHHGRAVTATLTGAGQAHATATSTAALVRSLADGAIATPGAWMPEQVIAPAPFFHRLSQAGLHVKTSDPEPAI